MSHYSTWHMLSLILLASVAFYLLAIAKFSVIELSRFPVPKEASDDHADYTRSLVVAATLGENVSWVDEELSDEQNLTTFIYVVDNSSSDNPIPQNKGHEAMAYLTHVIEAYETGLSDINIFVHAHQFAWHNNDLLDRDTAQMVRRLSPAYVMRNGYVNLRCHFDPGCPAHILPHETRYNPEIPEAAIMGQAWMELFPDVELPEVLAQPCCAQMAVTRELIHSLPLYRYEQLRAWLLETTLDDSLSGRVFEYTWQYLWGHRYQFCPKQSVCYCDGYGICFGGEEEYDIFQGFKNIAERDAQVPAGHSPKNIWHSYRSDIQTQLERWKVAAVSRGLDPKRRALEAGRL